MTPSGNGQGHVFLLRIVLFDYRSAAQREDAYIAFSGPERERFAACGIVTQRLIPLAFLPSNGDRFSATSEQPGTGG